MTHPWETYTVLAWSVCDQLFDWTSHNKSRWFWDIVMNERRRFRIFRSRGQTNPDYLRKPDFVWPTAQFESECWSSPRKSVILPKTIINRKNSNALFYAFGSHLERQNAWFWWFWNSKMNSRTTAQQSMVFPTNKKRSSRPGIEPATFESSG